MTAEAVVKAKPSMRRSRFLGSLARQDRRLLLVCLGIVGVFILLVAFVGQQEDDESVVPSSFSAASRGAEAAYLMLGKSGYKIERWEQPLDQLVSQSDENTVLVLAQPNFTNAKAGEPAIRAVLDRGGRVLATGLTGAFLLPEEHASSNVEGVQGECNGVPEGLGTLADSGVIQMRPVAEWQPVPNQRAQYTCNGKAIVVSYRVGKGTVVWWADSQPLENATIAKDGNLALLLNSLGPRESARIVWDESLHEEPRGLWSYASGTPVHLLWAQMALVGVLLVLSFSRRSGPMLPDPVVARDAPLEFVQSLGALYEKAGATNIVVKVAYDRLRLALGRAVPVPESGATERAEQMVSVLSARLGDDPPNLKTDILMCEQTAYESRPLPAAKALALVRSLWDYEERIRKGSKGIQE